VKSIPERNIPITIITAPIIAHKHAWKRTFPRTKWLSVLKIWSGDKDRRDSSSKKSNITILQIALAKSPSKSI